MKKPARVTRKFRSDDMRKRMVETEMGLKRARASGAAENARDRKALGSVLEAEPVYRSTFEVRFSGMPRTDARLLEEQVVSLDYSRSIDHLSFGIAGLNVVRISMNLNEVDGRIQPLAVLEAMRDAKKEFVVTVHVQNKAGKDLRTITFTKCRVSCLTTMNSFSYEDQGIFDLQVELSFEKTSHR